MSAILVKFLAKGSKERKNSNVSDRNSGKK